MTLTRCAWHQIHWLAIMGVSTWRPLSSLTFSDGMCRWCARRLLRAIPSPGNPGRREDGFSSALARSRLRGRGLQRLEPGSSFLHGRGRIHATDDWPQ
jgi:hypothetical protein